MQFSGEAGREFLDKKFRERVLKILEITEGIDQNFDDDQRFYGKIEYLKKLLSGFIDDKVIIIQTGYSFIYLSQTQRFKLAEKKYNSLRPP